MDNQFDEFENGIIRRRKLLPWWMRFFSWMFMIMGGIAVLSLITLIGGEFPALVLYGFDATNGAREFLIVFPLFILNGLTGYFLYFEKDEAIILAKICGIVGIIACIASIAGLSNDGSVFRLEIILLILFLVRIFKMDDEWKYGRKLSV